MKKVAVLGTGNVGQTIGSKLIELGYFVCMGSRTSDNEKALAWVDKNGDKASTGTYSDAASDAEFLYNCTAGVASIEVIKSIEYKNRENKILIDVANPLDFSKGMPPTLQPVNHTSLGEELQNTFPELKVVKALNTMWCGLMVNPGLIHNGDHHTFICGNDSLAKNEVKKFLLQFGWLDSHILDLGDITASRGTEMYLPLWLRIWGSTKNGVFNIKIVS